MATVFWAARGKLQLFMARRNLMIKRSQFVTASAVALVLSMLPLLDPLAQAQTETVLHTFTGGKDGNYPIWYGNLVFDSKGNLYGTTVEGGTCITCGTLFRLHPSNGGWKKTVLYKFTGGNDGAQPDSGLAFDSVGNLYGTTVAGGTWSSGTVFELSPNPAGGGWTETVLYSFQGEGTGDGAFPVAPVVLDKSGNVYGTTPFGGAVGGGTVFELTRSGSVWSENILHSFSRSGNDGQNPYAALIMDKAGNLYGTTSQGGSYTFGTVFELSESNGAWTESAIYNFKNSKNDGAYPYGGVTFDQVGNLYGTTNYGGRGTDCSPGSCGAVFELSPGKKRWVGKILHSFKAGKDGSFPNAGVTLDEAGNVYGTTSFGGGGACEVNGITGCGTVFMLKKSGTVWREQIFTFNGENGAMPQGGIALDNEGNLYGATFYGGSGDCNNNLPGCGLVFELVP
jgi:uncharacterized repeat protein (TIGR03803 family)